MSAEQLSEAGVRESRLKQIAGDLRESSDGQRILASHRLCDPEARLFPVMQQRAGGAIGLVSNASLSRIAPKDLAEAISPDRVSPNFLTSVGIEHRTEGKEKKVVVDETLAAQIRLLLLNAEPLPKTDGRVLIITAGEKLAKDAGINGNGAGVTGSLLYLRRDPDKGDVLMHFPDVASALRKTFHQSRNENYETADLARLGVDARGIVTRLRSWCELESGVRAELKTEAAGIGMRADGALGAARLPEKQRAGESLVSAAQLQDSTGRVNPPASVVRYEWAARRLAERIEDVGSIGAFNRKDQLALLDWLLRDDAVFAGAAMRLESHLRSVAHFSIFSNGRIAADAADRQINGFFRNLGLDTESLQRVFTRPHLTFRDRIEEAQSEFRDAAKKRDADAGLAAVQKMYVVTRLAGFQHQLNLARLDLVNEEAGVPACKAQVQKLSDDLATLRDRKLSPERFFRAEFGGFAPVLADALKFLDTGTELNGKFIPELKKVLDRANIEVRLLRV